MLFDTNRRWITPTWYSFARIRLCTLPIIELDHLIRLENVTNRRASRARNAETTSCDWLADRQSGPLIWQTHQSDSSHDFVKPRIECFAIIIINLWCKVCVRLHGSPPPATAFRHAHKSARALAYESILGRLHSLLATAYQGNSLILMNSMRTFWFHWKWNYQQILNDWRKTMKNCVGVDVEHGIILPECSAAYGIECFSPEFVLMHTTNDRQH